MKRKSILLVEDDPQIQDLVTDQIDLLGYDLEAVADGEAGLARALEGSHVLVLLDVNLPRLGGIEVCRQLKQQRPHLPVILISASGAELDKVLGLRLGADDYVVKPFSVAELGARIQARLRDHTRSTGATDMTPAQVIIQAGPFEIDTEKRSVTKSGEPIELTALEFDLFALLASRPEIVFSREQLLEQIWGVSAATYESAITPVVNRLRKKIENIPAQPRYVVTVFSIGYRFSSASETSEGETEA